MTSGTPSISRYSSKNGCTVSALTQTNQLVIPSPTRSSKGREGHHQRVNHKSGNNTPDWNTAMINHGIRPSCASSLPVPSLHATCNECRRGMPSLDPRRYDVISSTCASVVERSRGRRQSGSEVLVHGRRKIYRWIKLRLVRASKRLKAARAAAGGAHQRATGDDTHQKPGDERPGNTPDVQKNKPLPAHISFNITTHSRLVQAHMTFTLSTHRVDPLGARVNSTRPH